ncbi:fatty acid desaturase [Paraglaciecola sp. MB-3u-78]|jgi:fatty acid desaturase|uniref:fatty acid desaturase family protein n=1 Tax=Paraglaciecola sp. MB-3u-78 TaxID=2058332 RepID=UPI000C337897|nr:fatty acid desaturase [Paraglaciecola sp. MB-3u-78]PKH00290.1 hypothetical protein CXF95_06730 [Paraglaciecola sp. MB-3u-78]
MLLDKDSNLQKSLSKVSTSRSFAYITIDLLVIVLLLAIMLITTKPFITLLGIIFIARQQYALCVLGHDAVHRRLFKDKYSNDIAGRFLINGFSGLSFDGYQFTHLKHHQNTMFDSDPDKRFVEDFPITKGKLLKQFIPDFLGLTWVYLFLYYLKNAYASLKSFKSLFINYLPALGMNFLLFSYFFVINQPWLFLFYWVLPMVVIMPVFMHIRGISEHACFIGDKTQMNCSRTIVNPLQSFFIAPHNLNYHMEHHTNPSVTHFNLQKYHDILVSQGKLQKHNLFTSYFSVIKFITTK